MQIMSAVKQEYNDRNDEKNSCPDIELGEHPVEIIDKQVIKRSGIEVDVFELVCHKEDAGQSQYRKKAACCCVEQVF